MSNRNIKIITSIFTMFLSLSVIAQEEEQAKTEPEKSSWLIVHAGTLLAVPGKPPLSEKTIVIHNDRFSRVLDGYVEAEQAIEPEPDDTVQVLDLSDSFVLPGLIDTHVHLSFEFDVDGQQSYGMAGEYVEQYENSKNDVYGLVTAIGNGHKTLQAGFTTVRNVGSSGWHIFALRDAIRDGNLSGPRIFTSGNIIRIGADDGPGACTSVESCRKVTREQIDMGADVIKIYTTCSGSKPCGYEHAPPVFLQDEFNAVVEVAASRELKVAAHAHSTAGINLAANSGAASIEHGSYNDKTSRKIMLENGVFLVPTLSVQDNIRKDIKDAKGQMLKVMQGFLDNHGPRMIASHKAGVKIASGSDAGVTVHGNNARELEFYVEYGMTPEDALVTATINAAELLGKQSELGTIEQGKLADLIAVNGNPLDDISVLKNVAVVVKDGKVAKNEL